MAEVESRFISVEGINTHYLEAGSGTTLVLLHSGEFGGCAELSWEFNIAALAEHFHVIAPDWLGFGHTDKLYDFSAGHKRMLQHMVGFLAAMNIDQADFVGNSMGGTFLARVAASEHPLFPIRRMVLASGGGLAPANEHRQALLDYDCTPEAMQRLLLAALDDPKWANDADYVARRQRFALIPGAWECAAAARFRSPATPTKAEFGGKDETPYGLIKNPTLIIAGANDKLRLPGYGQELQQQIDGSQLALFDDCGHCPNIEQAELFNQTVIDFLK